MRSVVLGMWLGAGAAEASPEGLVVHEWGTFTAVAGPDGAPVLWHPLDGSADLPDFVYGPSRLQEGLRQNPATKGTSALVRMETPVLYFYTDKPRTVDVSVRFVEGTLTEWYPRVRTYDGAGLDWGQVRLFPYEGEQGREATLPHDGSDSHYYPARAVPSATVQVCDERANETERFLFYRGLGQFPLSVRAIAEGQGVRVWTEGAAPATVLLFERRGGKVGYALAKPQGTLPRPALDDELPEVYGELVDQLVSAGLYRPEALAMVETWKGDWFEDGLRVLYLVPRKETDERLPLTVSPAPRELVRVLVGRLEVPTPEQKRALSQLLDSSDPDEAVLAEAVQRFGRFAEPWLATSGHARASGLLQSGSARPGVTAAH